jgi:hypothetical protein
MPIIGFNFTKINVERKEGATGKINIKNNVTIKDVDETDLALGKEKQKALKISFEFTSKYEPKIGTILIEGNLMFMGESKKVKEIMDGWSKDKKIPKDVMSNILNNILTRCNIQALILSQDVNLPPPIPLPKVQADVTDKGYIG